MVTLCLMDQHVLVDIATTIHLCECEECGGVGGLEGAGAEVKQRVSHASTTVSHYNPVGLVSLHYRLSLDNPVSLIIDSIPSCPSTTVSHYSPLVVCSVQRVSHSQIVACPITPAAH